MKQRFDETMAHFATRRKRRRILRRAMALLCAVTVLFTVNWLKFDADTLERVPTCGYPDHEHSPECYDDQGNLVCGLHVHTDACFQERPVREVPEFQLGGPEVEMNLATEEMEAQASEAVTEKPAPEEYSYSVGRQERLALSDVLAQAGMTVDMAQIEMVGITDQSYADLVFIEEVWQDGVIVDYTIRPTASFDQAEIAIVTADDILTVMLRDAVVEEQEQPAEVMGEEPPAEEEPTEVEEEQPPVGEEEQELPVGEEEEEQEQEQPIGEEEEEQEQEQPVGEEEEQEQEQPVGEEEEEQEQEQPVGEEEEEQEQEQPVDEEEEEQEQEQPVGEEEEEEEEQEQPVGEEVEEEEQEQPVGEEVEEEEQEQPVGEEEQEEEQEQPVIEEEEEEQTIIEEELPEDQEETTPTDEGEETEAHTQEEAISQEEAPETEEAPTQEEVPEVEEAPAPAYPAQRFEESTADVRVTVDAPEGAFPEGTAMVVRDVIDEQTLADIEDTVSEDFVEVKRVNAVDISFWYDGAEIEPLLPISVVMTVLELEESQEAVVVHVDDAGATEVIDSQTDQGAGEAELSVEMPAGIEGGTEADSAHEEVAGEDALAITPEAVAEESIAFEANAFSVYAVVVTETIETRYIDDSGENWSVSVGYGQDAGIPAGATLAVRELAGDEAESYYAQTAEALRGRETITLARYFDITILDADGNEVQPRRPVEVRATLADANDDAVKAVHFPEDDAMELLDADREDETVAFSAEGFSVYGIVYTVDFHYGVDGETYEFTLPGGGVMSLRELAEALNVVEGEDDARVFIGNVESVVFTDEELVRIVPVTENITAGGLRQKWGLEPEYSAELTEDGIAGMDDKVLCAPDFALVSLKPFTTDETLTVALRTGETFAIAVTDAQLTQQVIAASGETYAVTVTYSDDAGIPDGAELVVREILPGDETYAGYLNGAKEAAGIGTVNEAEENEAEPAGDGYARFFDIEIWAGDTKIEPEAPVSVSIDLADAPEDALKVVHFEADGPVVLDSEPGEASDVRFEAESFSVYGVIRYGSELDVGDLDGEAFVIRRGNQYMTSEMLNPGSAKYQNVYRMRKTNNANEAAVWHFEATGTANQYNIWTNRNNQQKWLHLGRYTDGWAGNADASLQDYKQAFTVSRNDDSTYSICVYDTDRNYYINEHYPNEGDSFAGYEGNNDGSHLTLDFVDRPTVESGRKYVVLIEYNDEYYVVENDGTLTKTLNYNPTDNSITAEDPMLWVVEGGGSNRHIYFETEAVGFTPDMRASDYFRRYLDPSVNNALMEENIGNVTVSEYGSWVEDGETKHAYRVTNRDAVLSQTTLSTAGDRVFHGSDYLGVIVENGVPVRVCGNASDANGAKVLFAEVNKVPDVGPRTHTVDHIDISISGTSKVDVPLAYGTYYYKDDSGKFHEFFVNSDITLHLENDDVVITPEDMKHATIEAYNRNTGEKLDDAFVVSGYSSNAHTNISTVQVRIAGRFKVALCNDVDTSQVNWSAQNDSDWNSPQSILNSSAVMAARKANQITYVVSATKPMSFDMIDDDHGQLYEKLPDGTYKALSVSLDIEMAASFGYFDDNNECPPLQPTYATAYYDAGSNRWTQTYVDNSGDHWRWIQGGIPTHGQSGMDFVLGGNAEEANDNVVAVEITKMIVDESGKLIKPEDTIVNKMEIWQNPGANANKDTANSVQNLNVEQYNGAAPDYSGYSMLRERSIAVGQSGMGQIYDYAVEPGMYFITEKHDAESLPRTITDVNGDVWEYKETVIKTEYVRRGNDYDNTQLYPNPMHVSKTYTLDDPSENGKDYASAPEVLGYFRTLVDEDKKNGFLEFYVYNVYVCGTRLEVEKDWAKGFTPPEGAEVTLELYYAARRTSDGDTPLDPSRIAGWPGYDAYQPVKGADGFDPRLNTTLTLKANAVEKYNWKGAFSNLPKTIRRDGDTWEVDYYAQEIAVKVNGVDVTNQYMPTLVKTEAEDDDALYSDGKLTVTNKLRDIEIVKNWYMPDGTQYTPTSAADRKAVVTAELWKLGTTTEHENSRKVTINVNKQGDNGYIELWSGWVKLGSDLDFSVGANGTSDLRNLTRAVSTGQSLEYVGSRNITYNTNQGSLSKPSANIFRLANITEDTSISVTFKADDVSGNTYGYYISHAETERVGEDVFDRDITLNAANGWSQTLTELDPSYSYYIKVDTIRETGTGGRFELNGPYVTTDGDKMIISLRNTNLKEYVDLDVEKAWNPAGSAPVDARVTLALCYYKRLIADSLGNAPESVADWPESVTFGADGYLPVAGDALFADEMLDESQLALTLDGSETIPWNGALEHLPKTVVGESGDVYEVDYAVREAAVVVNGEDVTGKYTAVAQKTRPATAGENGRATVTNTREQVQVSVQKQWEPTPTDANASVTVELRRYAKKTKGSIKLILTSDNGGAIGGATYVLYRDGVAGAAYTTDVNGVISITGLEPGSYYLLQTGNAVGYTMEGHDRQTGTFEVAEKTALQEKTFTMKNGAECVMGVFTLTLTDAVTGEPLQGATFTLKKQGGADVPGYATNGAGRIVVDNLGPGTYWFVQNSALEGYKPPETAASDTFVVPDEPGRHEGSVAVTNIKQARGSVTLTLRNESNEPLSGGVFTLYRGGQPYAHGGNSAFTTDGSGTINLTELPAGAYSFVQTVAPQGYDRTSEDLSFVVPDNGKTNNQVSVSATDPKETGNVTIRLWRKGMRYQAWEWDSMATYDGLIANRTYTFTASFDSRAYDNGVVWYYQSEGEIHNSDSLDQSKIQNLNSACWNSGSYTFTFTPTRDNVTYNLVIVSNWGKDSVYSFEKVSDASNGSRAMTRAAVKGAGSARTASKSRAGIAVSNATGSNVTTAQPAPAPAGYMEDSSFAVQTHTITGADGWAYTFDPEDRYDAFGNPYYYYVVETACGLDYYDLTGYSGDPVGDVESGTIRITNAAKRGSLKLTKTLESVVLSGDDDWPFTFTISFTGDKAANMKSSYAAIKTNASGGTSDTSVAVSGGVVTVALQANESIEILDLPYGVSYAVTEADDPEFEISGSTGLTGTVSKNTNASVENRRVLGSITVTKQVKLNGTLNPNAAGKTFWVAIFRDANGTQRVDGQQDRQITIAADGTGSTTFTDLPVGTYYVYELTSQGGSVVTGADATIDAVQYTVTTDNTGAVVSKSDRMGEALIENNVSAKGTLTVDKVTLYNGAPDAAVAGKTIRIGLYGSDGETPVRDPGDNSRNWVKTMTLNANGAGSVTFPELDLGKYHVYELDDAGNPVKGQSQALKATINEVEYTVSQDKTNVTFGENHRADSVTITNSTEEEGSLEVTKEIQVDGEAANLSGTFKVALYEVSGETEAIVGEPRDIAVTNGVSETVTFEHLTVGKTYRLYEVTVEGSTVTKAGERFGQYAVSYQKQTVTIPRGAGRDITGAKAVNNIETVNVSVDKTWLQPDGTDITDSILNAEVSVRLMNGGTVITQDADGAAFGTEGTVTLPQSGDWSFEWAKLPKYDANGDEIEYAVVETSARVATNVEGGTELLAEDETIEATRDTDPARPNVFHLENRLPGTELHVEKAWALPDEDSRHPDSITYNLLVNGAVADTKAAPKASGYKADWTGLKKYAGDGSLLAYAVEEVPVENYTRLSTALKDETTNNTYVVTNKLGKTSRSLSGSKRMADGEDPGTYSFELRALDGAPMPTVTGSVITDGVLTVHNVAGEISFGSIDFLLRHMSDGTGGYLAEKTFSYEIREADEGDAGIIYSTAVYTASITVRYNSESGEMTADAPVYTVKASPDADASAATGIEFVNREVVHVEATKTWKDANEQPVNDTMKHATVAFTLQQKTGDGDWSDVPPVEDALENPKTMTVDDTADADEWKVEWNDLPKYYKPEGSEPVEKIMYRVVETAARIMTDEDEGENVLPRDAPVAEVTFTGATGTVNIDNTLPETGISVTKQWKDGTGSANDDRVFPETKNIRFILYQKLGDHAGTVYHADGLDNGIGEIAYTPASGEAPAAWSTVEINGLPRFVYSASDETWYRASYYVAEQTIIGVRVTYVKGQQAAADIPADAAVADADTDRLITIVNTDELVDLEIVKVDSDGMTKPLPGAGFELLKVKESNPTTPDGKKITNPATTGDGHLTGADGKATFEGIPAGYYRVSETVVPAGYILTNAREFFIHVDGGAIELVKWVVEDNVGSWQSRTASAETDKLTFETTANGATVTVGNDAGVALPATGGIGTTVYYAAGILLIALSAALLLTRRRRDGE